MPYKVKLQELLPQKIMSVTFETDIKHLSINMNAIFTDLYEYLKTHNAKMTGTCDALYHTVLFNPQKIVVECAFGVTEFAPQTEQIKGRLDEGGLMATTVHQGPYDKLEAAYKAVMKWMDENGYGYTAIMRDRYINSPTQVPPENLLTEIYWPVNLKK